MFNGTVKAEWLEGGREMRLLEKHTFTDSAGKVWESPAGSIIDGASIPEILWSLVGSPYCGKYRDASVPHDRYCKTRSEPHDAVHKMFYEAMLAVGVPEDEAKTLYLAVKKHGPKWDENGKDLKGKTAHEEFEDLERG